ncbi:MAG: 50S ribosomal protein L4 [Firmicutes bacterium]|nr:50S ribosomal protein L4 [Bacillota bacterium]
MPEIDLYTMQGEKKGTMSLSEDIFAVEPNMTVMNQALLRHLANRRSGSASTKTRAEVAGGGRKPWRQKGTGRSRHGSIRSPLWRGGGVTFGPKPRDYNQAMPKKMRRLAIKCAYSVKVTDKKMFALDELKMEMPKTKQFVDMMKKLNLDKSVLFVIDEKNFAVEKSASNIPGIKVVTTEGVNIHDLMKFDRLVMTTSAIKKVEEVLI